MIAAANFLRQGVIAGFALSVPGSGLTPAFQRGVLFAQGIMYRPGVDPAVPSAPVSQLSYLGYNSSSGFYWTVNPAGNTAGDAVVGWVATDGADVVAVSSQVITIAAAVSSGGSVGVGGSIPSSDGGGSSGGDGALYLVPST